MGLSSFYLDAIKLTRSFFPDYFINNSIIIGDTAVIYYWLIMLSICLRCDTRIIISSSHFEIIGIEIKWHAGSKRLARPLSH